VGWREPPHRPIPTLDPRAHGRRVPAAGTHIIPAAGTGDFDGSDGVGGGRGRVGGVDPATVDRRALHPSNAEVAEPVKSHYDAVIKVFCTHVEPHFSLPWQRRRQATSTSSGFVIEGPGRRVLTNAHSVEFHQQVRASCKESSTTL